jgi:tetratricopeptide (TPR) repeat protein
MDPATESSYVELFPVWHAMQSELSAAEEWASELARWYEADCRSAAMGGPFPCAERVLEQLTPERRPLAQRLFGSIDQHYRSAVRQGSRGTVAGEGDETVAVSPQGGASEPVDRARPAIRLSGDGEVSTGAVEVTTGPSRPTGPLESSETVDFSADANSDKPPESRRVYRSDTAKAKARSLEIPGYAVLKTLGRGGMGVVYLARQVELDRLVALKMILGGAHADRQATERFLVEARAVAKLQHENVVRLYEIGWHHNLPYFALEYIEGESLSQRLGAEPMDPVEAAGLLQQLTQGLAHAHAAGIVHRDLKPGNVLISSAGVPKLVDFGLARQLESQSELSRTGDVLGTPSFMSPEQARGEREIGFPADVYGMGGVLYAMLTGRPPFLAAKPVDTLLQVLEAEPVAPSTLQPGVPKDLETICLKCLRKEPRERYGSAEELGEDLQRFLSGEPIRARPVGRVERVYRWSRRKPLVASLTAIAGLLGLTLMIGGPITAAVIQEQKRSVVSAKEAAEKNEQAAVNARQLADRNSEQARQNAQRAAENAERARQNAEAAITQEKNAIDALKSLVFEVQRRMKDQPDLQSVRQSLLQVATNGVARMEKREGNVADANLISAAIHRRLGDLNLELGRVTAARDDYQRCLDILLQLESRGELPNLRHNLSTAYELLAESSRRAGDLVPARQYAEQCLEQRRRWSAEQPGDEDVLQNVAATLGQIGTLAQQQGDMQAARAYLTESAELRKRYLEARPGNLDPQVQWIGARRALARLTFQEGQQEQALQEIEAVIAEQQKIVDLLPNSVGSRANLAVFHADAGTFHVYRGHFQQAVEKFQEAERTIRELIERDPKNFQLKEMHATFLYGLSVAHRELGDTVVADEKIRQAITLRHDAVQAEPDNVARQISYLLALARGGDLKTAVSLLGPIEKGIPADGDNYFHLACAYAQLFAAAGTDPSAASGEAAEKWAQRAIELMEQSHQLGFRRSTDLAMDPDLAPIRDRERYQQLLQRHQTLLSGNQ